MSTERRPVPRLFLIRHGETEWTITGRHTGRSDIPLTDNGVHAIAKVAPAIVGTGKFIDPAEISRAFVSPRQRATRTFEVLFSNSSQLPQHEFTEEAREWDYGDYEGLTPSQIQERNPGWSIWKHGAPGGESVDEMAARVDCLISKIREIHRQYFEEGIGHQDCMVVAHGHLSRAFIARWLRFPLNLGQHFTVDPAGISVLTYNHRSLDEPSIANLNLQPL
ncbi:hypothetical protein FRB99_002082 [Tulasnella sp. 403]|nr:hypothetical protein FRB99_002082 [Tulasnella sp. 403]